MEKLDSWIKIITAITPIITVIIGFLGASIIQQLVVTYQKRRLKNILNAVETQNLMNLIHDEFKTDFIIPDVEENYFFVQTGIKTNHKSIKKY